YDNGESNEGRAFVYCGSASGLSTTPNWTAESDQADAYFGYSVGTAGDVDGDSYDDVIVGAYTYDNGEGNEGRAYLFQGSSVGLNAAPSWTAESDQVYAYFGYSVGTAGDVNADGYADVVVGAYQYDHGQSDEGRAYAYLGSGAGLDAIASWTADIDQASAYFGCSLATAGDVNDDSCADIIVGAYSYDNGESNEGRAYAYHGSVSGLPPTPPIYVPDDYPTITAALAGSSPGDTIIVRDGTYTESVTVSTDNLTIRSENGPETTAVQAPSISSDVFTIRAEDVTISGFTVTGASALGSIGIEIYPWDATNCSIIGNIILSNYYGIQGALDSDCATIKDNYILSSGSYGIWLHDTDNNTITGNTMLSNAHGIDMWDSSNNWITNNTISGSAQGIMLSFSGSSSTISSNHISSCTQWGIEVGNDGGNIISYNTVSNSETGISVGKLASGGGYNIVTGNTLVGNDMAISVSGGTNQITQNTILESTGRGIRVLGSAKTDFDNIIDTTNTVNGKPVYYYYDQSGLVLDGLDAGHLTLAYCSNSTVRNSSISNGDGVYLRYSDGNSFSGNVISSNSEDGVYFLWSHNNTITNNTLSFNRRDGIYLSGSDGNQIIDNMVTHNTDGIYLWDYSDGNLVTGNTVLSSDGIGVYLRYSDNNVISGNTVSGSTSWGIYLFWGCDYNLIYHNNLIDNVGHISQAGDYSQPDGATPVTNSWDDGAVDGGNYWSDHSCTGNPSDGSQPYYIEGFAGDATALDHYPFQDPDGWAPSAMIIPPTLLSPANGATISYGIPRLDWSDVSDVVVAIQQLQIAQQSGPSDITYHLQLDDNADFSSPVREEAGLTTSEYTVPEALLDGTYYWRVRVEDDAGNQRSEWTTPWSFTVLQNQPVIMGISPSQGARGQTITVVISGLYLGGVTTVDFGEGITVNSVSLNELQFNGLDQITVSITIDAGAELGLRDVSVTTPGGTGTKTEGFTVLE
ncbi:MAG: right-handed parallel beta-helix repeat-containing protein, partial [Dehalococcoidia bacterium]|nr:right-handed parallel beta-helix repeat-containing protein [Dehalococcoidia bacterium]